MQKTTAAIAIWVALMSVARVNFAWCQDAQGELEFLKGCMEQTAGPITAAKFYNAPSYEFKMTFFPGKFSGRVRINPDSIYYELDFLQLKDGKYLDHTVSTHIFIHRTSKTIYTPHRCDVAVNPYKQSPDRLMGDHYLEAFLPSSWMMTSTTPLAYHMLKSPTKVDHQVEVKQGQLYVNCKNVTPQKTYHYSMVFARPTPLLDSIRITDEKGKTLDINTECEWETKDGKTLLTRRITREKAATYEYEASRLQDANWGYSSLSEFKKSLPSGTRWREFASDGKERLVAYLGDDPASAKSDYERRVLAEKLRIRNEAKGKNESQGD